MEDTLRITELLYEDDEKPCLLSARCIMEIAIIFHSFFPPYLYECSTIQEQPVVIS